MAEGFPLEEVMTIVGGGLTRRLSVRTGRREGGGGLFGRDDPWETTVQFINPDGSLSPLKELGRHYGDEAAARAGHRAVVEEIQARGVNTGA